MQRRRFFFFERFAIPRRERIAVTGLFAAVLFFSAALYFFQQKVYYDERYYRDLERVFLERSNRVIGDEDRSLQSYDQWSRNVSESEGHRQPAVEGGASDSDTLKQRERIDLNRADQNRLQKLPGVGPVYARRIVVWRERNGPFRLPDQLLEVKGIGPVRMEAIRPLVKVSPAETDSLSPEADKRD